MKEDQLSRESSAVTTTAATEAVTAVSTADKVHLRQVDKHEASGEGDAGRPLPPHRTVPGRVGLTTRPVDGDHISYLARGSTEIQFIKSILESALLSVTL